MPPNFIEYNRILKEDQMTMIISATLMLIKNTTEKKNHISTQ
jgi:hypothetical protein